MVKNFILLSCTCFVCLAFFEAFLFVMPQYQAGEPLAAHVFCEGQPPEQRPSPTYGMTGAPDSLYFRRESEADGWYLRAYNHEGFRDLLDTGDENVIVLGDSFIEGESVNNDETIPYLLDSWNPDLAFHEFALGGWGTMDEYHAYQAAAKTIDHRLIVLGYYVGNDLADNIGDSASSDANEQSAGADDEGSVLFDIHVALRAYSRAYSFLYVNGRRTLLEFLGLNSLEDRYVSPSDIDHGLDATRDTLLKLSDTASKNGADVLIVILPSWNELIEIEGEQRLAARQREVIQAVAAAKPNVHLLDVKSMVEDAGFDRLYGRVDKHFNQLGYYSTAAAIHQWINETWRDRSAPVPAMHERDVKAMQPDCDASTRHLKAFSKPAEDRMTQRS